MSCCPLALFASSPSHEAICDTSARALPVMLPRCSCLSRAWHTLSRNSATIPESFCVSAKHRWPSRRNSGRSAPTYSRAAATAIRGSSLYSWTEFLTNARTVCPARQIEFCTHILERFWQPPRKLRPLGKPAASALYSGLHSRFACERSSQNVSYGSYGHIDSVWR